MENGKGGDWELVAWQNRAILQAQSYGTTITFALGLGEKPRLATTTPG